MCTERKVKLELGLDRKENVNYLNNDVNKIKYKILGISLNSLNRLKHQEKIYTKKYIEKIY